MLSSIVQNKNPNERMLLEGQLRRSRPHQNRRLFLSCFTPSNTSRTINLSDNPIFKLITFLPRLGLATKQHLRRFKPSINNARRELPWYWYIFLNYLLSGVTVGANDRLNVWNLKVTFKWWSDIMTSANSNYSNERCNRFAASDRIKITHW